MGQNYTYTTDIIKGILKEFDFELVDKFYNGDIRKLTMRDHEGYIYLNRLENVRQHKKMEKFSKTNTYTIENIKHFILINNYLFELVSTEYKSSRDYLVFKDKEGYYYSGILVNMVKGSIMPFHKGNPYTVQNIKLWCKLNNKPFELVSKIYNGTHEDLKWKCLKDDCGEIFKANWSHLHNDRGCPFCAGVQVGLSNCLATLNPKLAKQWHPTKNTKTTYDVTLSGKDSCWWLCENDNTHEWESTVYNRNNGSGCPQCNEYRGEKRCKEVFVSNKFIEITQADYDKLLNIDKHNNTYFIPQKTFIGLIGLGRRLLSYDFYIPKYNLLIEYQGEYHDGTARNQTPEEFEIQKEHDRRKKEYAKQNGYNFLEIWYWDFDKIEEILTEYLMKIRLGINSEITLEENIEQVI